MEFEGNKHVNGDFKVPVLVTCLCQYIKAAYSLHLIIVDDKMYLVTGCWFTNPQNLW